MNCYIHTQKRTDDWYTTSSIATNKILYVVVCFTDAFLFLLWHLKKKYYFPFSISLTDCMSRRFLFSSSSSSLLPFAVKVKSYFCILPIRRRFDDKTFKNIRCYCRWCFPLVMCVFFILVGFVLALFFFNRTNKKKERELQCYYCYCCGRRCCCCCCYYYSHVMLLFRPWIRRKKMRRRLRTKIYIYIYVRAMTLTYQRTTKKTLYMRTMPLEYRRNIHQG